jgi:hypothetical protein
MLNENIKSLFKAIVYNCPIESVESFSVKFKVGDSTIEVAISKLCKDLSDVKEIKPMSIDDVRYFGFPEVSHWTIHSPKYPDLPIHEFTLRTPHRSYHVEGLTLEENIEISKHFNKILAEYEDAQLQKLMVDALK